MPPGSSPTSLGSPGTVQTTLGLTAAGTPMAGREASRGCRAHATRCGGERNHSRALRIRLGKVEEPSALPFGLAPRPLPPGARNLRIQGHGLALQDPVPLAGSAWAECLGPLYPLPSQLQACSQRLQGPLPGVPLSAQMAAGIPLPTRRDTGVALCWGGWTELNYVDWGVHVQGFSVRRMEPGWGPTRAPRNLRV